MQKEVYKGKIIRVTEEEINGIVWERSYLPDGVIVFPIDGEGRILLVNEKRPHETPPYRIKPVSGILELEKGSPEDNAQREMQEEIGFKAGRLEQLWTQKASGTVNNEQHYFIAWDLLPSKLPNPDGEDTIMGIVAYTPKELIELIMRDELRWSMSTLGIFRLLKRLGAMF
jgi:8-oxo-dGTP pyrophosphatase MutT (NUDIX family)